MRPSCATGWDRDTFGFHSDDGNIYANDISDPFQVVGRRFGEGDVVGCGIVFEPFARLGRDPEPASALPSAAANAQPAPMTWYDVVTHLHRLQGWCKVPDWAKLLRIRRRLADALEPVGLQTEPALHRVLMRVLDAREQQRWQREQWEGQGQQHTQQGVEAEGKEAEDEEEQGRAMTWDEWSSALVAYVGEEVCGDEEHPLCVTLIQVLQERKDELAPLLSSESGVARATCRSIVFARIRMEVDALRMWDEVEDKHSGMAAAVTEVLASILLASCWRLGTAVPSHVATDGTAAGAAGEQGQGAGGGAGASERVGESAGARGGSVDAAAEAAVSNAAVVALARTLDDKAEEEEEEGEDGECPNDVDSMSEDLAIGMPSYAAREAAFEMLSIRGPDVRSVVQPMSPVTSRVDDWARVQWIVAPAVRLARRVAAVRDWPSAAAEEALRRPVDAEEQKLMWCLKLPIPKDLTGRQFRHVLRVCAPGSCCEVPELEGTRNAILGCAFPSNRARVFFTCNGALVCACARAWQGTPHCIRTV